MLPRIGPLLLPHPGAPIRSGQLFRLFPPFPSTSCSLQIRTAFLITLVNGSHGLNCTITVLYRFSSTASFSLTISPTSPNGPFRLEPTFPRTNFRLSGQTETPRKVSPAHHTPVFD